MKKKFYLIAAFIIGLLLISLNVSASKNGNRPINRAPEPNPIIADIAQYKEWQKVNGKPIKFAIVNPQLCAAPSIGHQALPTTQFEQGIHKDKFITVYVNKAGKSQMMADRITKFPVGTTIVKEKLATPDSTEPELLTVMIKRARGFDTRNGDWEYLVLSGDAQTVTAEGKIESCISCHRTVKDNDYVFRNYLTKSEKIFQRTSQNN